MMNNMPTMMVVYPLQPQSDFCISCPKNSLKSILANIQLSRLIQYLTFGISIVPCISPAFLSSVRCCETVALAIGSSSLISPK